MTLLHTAHLRAKPDAVEAYKARLLRHARTSLECEFGGCLRFDVHQDKNDPALFSCSKFIATRPPSKRIEARRIFANTGEIPRIG